MCIGFLKESWVKVLIVKKTTTWYKTTTKVTSNLFRFLNLLQPFMSINALTYFNPTIPTWDCVSLRGHKTSQKIPQKYLQTEMNEEFELKGPVIIYLEGGGEGKIKGGQNHFRLARGGGLNFFITTFRGSAVWSRGIFYEGSIGRDG